MLKRVGKIVYPVYSFTLFGPNEFPINLDTVRSGCIEGLYILRDYRL